MTKEELKSESIRLINLLMYNRNLFSMNPLALEYTPTSTFVDLFANELCDIVNRAIMERGKTDIDDSTLLKALSDKVAESVIEKMKEVNK